MSSACQYHTALVTALLNLTYLRLCINLRFYLYSHPCIIFMRSTNIDIGQIIFYLLYVIEILFLSLYMNI